MLLPIALVVLVSVVVQGQQVPQCQCSTFNPCFAHAAEEVMQCADKCQNHFVSLGASYPAARACLQSHISQIRQTINCAKGNFGDWCASAPGKTVPKRYSEMIELAAFREVNQIVTKSGLGAQSTGLIQIAKKAVGCILKCVQTQGCQKGCSLALPTDSVIVSTYKNCAMSAGLLSTGGLREICGCLNNAGMKQLAPICPKIQI